MESLKLRKYSQKITDRQSVFVVWPATRSFLDHHSLGEGGSEAWRATVKTVATAVQDSPSLHMNGFIPL